MSEPTAQFRTVGLVGRAGSNTQVVESVIAVARCLLAAGVELVLEGATAKMAGAALTVMGETSPGFDVTDRAGLSARCDLIVVVGGDGSILGVARDVAHSGTPVVGVNRGGLGFLADVSPEQIEDKLGAVLEGQYTIDERCLLDARVERGAAHVGASTALNDVVVHAGAASRMMDFELFINGDFVYRQRSDGVIVATPTGSTAYALSAGGPIMHPRLDAIVVVPMFPHTLTSRPLVVPGDAEIEIVVGSSATAPQVSCDSQVNYEVRPGDAVTIRKHAHTLHLAYPRGHSFFESCRSKLDWASRLGER